MYLYLHPANTKQNNKPNPVSPAYILLRLPYANQTNDIRIKPIEKCARLGTAQTKR